MKKIILVLCILILLLSFQIVASADVLPKNCTKFEYGVILGTSTPDDVMALCPADQFVEVYANGQDRSYKAGKVAGIDDVIIRYSFNKNGILAIIGYFFPVEDKNYTKLASDYEMIDTALKKVYGKPQIDPYTFIDPSITEPSKSEYESYFEDGNLSQESIFFLANKYGVSLTHSLHKTNADKVYHYIKFSFDAAVVIEAKPKEQASTEVVELSSGEYDVGTHISSGEYVVTPIKSAIITVYRNGDIKTVEYLSVDKGDEIGRIVLKFGDVVEISGGKLKFSPFR